MVNEITVEERIKRCLLLERMEANEEYSKELGLENKSFIKKIRRINTLEQSVFPNSKDGE